MKPSHRIFFAIPFDAATRAMYGRVARRIRRRFASLTTVIGNFELGPSPRYSSIATFRAQNRELTSQFVAQIRVADVVVADLTHNNPNVHVELGIALTENKNILRVTGRSLGELGFDVRNLEVAAYRSEEDLEARIIDYLRMFFSIKSLALSPRHAQLNRRLSRPMRLDGLTPRPGLRLGRLAEDSFVLRDGAVRASFSIRQALNPDDWFGIYFRSGANPLLGSHLLYVRATGAVELAVYPGPDVTRVFAPRITLRRRQTIEVAFENDWLEVRLGGARFVTDALTHQAVGNVYFAAWQADVTVHAALCISRDTVDTR